MPISRFWEIPEKRKFAAGILIVLIFIFFLILVVRSCHKPEGESPKKYLQSLTSPVPENRLDAVLGLGRINAKGAVPDLEKVLISDPDERVRRSAAYSILILDWGKFLNLLKSPDANIRALGLETITGREKEKAFSYLKNGLSDPAILVRRTAFQLLTQQTATAETEVVFLRLAEKTAEDTSLRIDALVILGVRMAPEANLSRLKDLAEQDKEPTVRTAAGAAINKIENRKKANQ